MLARSSLTAAIALAAGHAAFAQPESRLASIVPDDVWLIAEAPTLRASWDRLSATALGKVWQMPAIREAMIEAIEFDAEETAAWFEKLEIDPDEAEIPAGAAGFALFANFEEVGEDIELAEDVGLLGFIELGDTVDFYEPAIESFVERGEDEGWFTVELDAVGDAEIFSLIEVVPEEEREPREEGIDYDDDGVMDDFYTIPATEPNEIYFAIAGETLLIGTHFEIVETGLDGLAGDLPRTLAADELYNETRAISGEGEDLYVYASVDALWESLESAAEDFPDPEETQALIDVLDASGVRTTQSIGLAVGLDTPDAEIEYDMVVKISEMRGAWGLLGTQTGTWTPSGVVPADAFAAGRFVFDWDGIFPLLRQIVAVFPADERLEAQAGLGASEGLVAPIFAGFADEMQYTQSIARPFAMDSQRGAVSIATADGTALLNTLNTFAPDMGMEPRAFAGGQIFDADLFFFTISLGVGNGQTVLGDSASVEQIMRTAGDAGQGLADSERFQRATEWFSPNAFTDSYNRLDETVLYSIWQMQNQDELMRQQYLEMGWEEAELDEWIGEIPKPEWLDKLPPAEEIAKLFGDISGQGHVIPEGLRLKSRMHRPE